MAGPMRHVPQATGEGPPYPEPGELPPTAKLLPNALSRATIAPV